jgi:hypothetical protein
MRSFRFRASVRVPTVIHSAAHPWAGTTKEMSMSTQSPRLNRLLREALGHGEKREPDFVRTCVVIAVVAAAIAVIRWGALVAPERAEAAYTTTASSDSIANPAATSWPAPRANDSAANTQAGNVVDLTF